jgi:hypothetical protein
VGLIACKDIRDQHDEQTPRTRRERLTTGRQNQNTKKREWLTSQKQEIETQEERS